MKTDNDRAQAHIEATARQIATDEAVLGMTPTNDKVDQSGADENFPVAHQFYEGGAWHNFLNERHHLETVKAGYPIRTLYASPQQAVAASEPVQDEYEAFSEWYEKEAPVEGEVSEIDMARHGWLAGRRYASTNQPVQAKALTDEFKSMHKLVPVALKPDCCDEGANGSGACCGNGACGFMADKKRASESWSIVSQPSAQADVAAVRDAAINECAAVCREYANSMRGNGLSVSADVCCERILKIKESK